jgi:hypothetical protein
MLAGLVLALSAGEVPHAIGQRTRTRILSAVDETLGSRATLNGDSGSGAARGPSLHGIPAWHGWEYKVRRLLDEVRKRLCIV